MQTRKPLQLSRIEEFQMNYWKTFRTFVRKVLKHLTVHLVLIQMDFIKAWNMVGHCIANELKYKIAFICL